MLYKILCLLLLSSSASMASTTFHFKGSESPGDFRHHYIQKVLTLALDKTVAEYGEYQLIAAAEGLNVARTLLALQERSIPNFFARVSMTDEIAEQFAFVPFPVDRGVAGYRIALVQNGKEKIGCNQPVNLQDYAIVQGLAWLDGDILRANNLQVYDSSSYDKMFEMTNTGRMDMFFRAINEIKYEYDTKSKALKGLRIESCMALHYPLPRFFVTDKTNKANSERVLKGLEKAYQDGSFQRLWRQFFKDSMDWVGLSQRKIVKLNNPFIENLNKDYERYNFKMNHYLQSGDAD